MTYKELLERLQKLSAEQLHQNVTVHLTEVDEFVPVHGVCLTVDGECDVLDEGHIILAS
jgi:hypothetical protein